MIRHAYRLFGSWEAALEAAGVTESQFTPNLPHGFWDRQRVLSQLQARAAAGLQVLPRAQGPTPGAVALPVSLHTGGLADANEYGDRGPAPDGP